MKSALLVIGISLFVIVYGKDAIKDKDINGKHEIYHKDVKSLKAHFKDVPVTKAEHGASMTKFETEDGQKNKDNISGNKKGEQKEIYHKEFHKEHFGNHKDHHKGKDNEEHKDKNHQKWIHRHTEHHKEHVKNEKEHHKRKQKEHHIAESNGQYKEHHKEHKMFHMEHHKNHHKQRDHKEHTYQKKHQNEKGGGKHEDKHKKEHYEEHKEHHKEHLKEHHKTPHQHHKTHRTKPSKQQHQKFHKDSSLGMRHKIDYSKDKKSQNSTLKQNVPVKYGDHKTEKYVQMFHGKEIDKSQTSKTVKDISDKTKMKDRHVDKQFRKKKNWHLKHGKHHRKFEKQSYEKSNKLNGRHKDDHKVYKFVKPVDGTNHVHVKHDKKQKNGNEKAVRVNQKQRKFVNKSDKMEKPNSRSAQYHIKSKKVNGKHRKGVGCKKMRICPIRQRPVCGNDGLTYHSKCQLKLAACRKGHRKAILLVHHGECKKQ